MITLVGCGFLGSIFAEEVAKLWFAFEERTPIRLIDSDAFEERNAANQNCTLDDADMGKALTVSDRLREYHIEVGAYRQRLVQENKNALLEGSSVIVSAVDNMPTRRLLWHHAIQYRIPLLSLGVSQSGTGAVEWTIGNYDTWSLSPRLTVGQTKKIDNEANLPQELKPCELIAFRGLGLNCAVAGAKALGIWRGFDPAKDIGDVLPEEFATSWTITNTSHALRETSPDLLLEDPFPTRAEEVVHG